MKFLHILPINTEGSTLYGLSLDTIHSDSIDCKGLKEWVGTLADQIALMDDDSEHDAGLTLREGFLLQLQAYCLYVASCDGPIHDRIVDAVNWLIELPSIDLDRATAIVDEFSTAGLQHDYPATFQLLVMQAAGSKADVIAAGQIYYFYHQVARYVYSVEHTDEFDEHSNAREYVLAFKKYVERVSVLGLALPPEGERSIDAVCAEWDRLMKAERDQLAKDAVGSWKIISDNSWPTDRFSNIVLTEDGRGHAGKHMVTWGIKDLEGVQIIGVNILDLGAIVTMLPLTSDVMGITVYSIDPQLHLKNAICHRQHASTNAAPQGTPTAAFRNVPASTPSVEQVNTNMKRAKGKVPWGLIAVVVAIVGFIIYNTSVVKPAKTYEQATNLYEAGQYRMAANSFESLGDYQDANEMEQKALLGLAAEELEEEAGEDPDAWKAAAEAYEQLDDGNAQSKAEMCRAYAAYYRGKKLMESGKWEKARKILEGIEEESFEDVSVLLDECDAHIAYAEAEALLADGKYYEAYVIYDALKDSGVKGLPDVSERAQACIQDFPKTGPVYTNPSYESSAVPLVIKNRAGNTYYKIYDGETLAMTVFIEPGASASVSLPAGSYRMNEAHGDQWFGEEDMFGGKGRYYRCTFGDSAYADLEWGYSYEISTSYNFSLNDGNRIENEEIDKDSF